MKTIPILQASSALADADTLDLAAHASAVREAFCVSAADRVDPRGRRMAEDAATLAVFLDTAAALDAARGPDAPIVPILLDDALAEGLQAAVRLAAAGVQAEQAARVDAVVIGIALWAMRHGVPLPAWQLAPVVNALAARANAAATRQDAAAVYALMQGVIAHVAPMLSADPERSDPERPWRILNLNFAIAAVRTGDTAMIGHAFTQLERALPDECAGFYDEAARLSASPGFPAETRDLVERARQRFSAGVQ